MADSTSPIKFGTSGWRAVMAEDFTFANVATAVDAIAGFLQTEAGGRRAPSVVVGYDTRFLSDRFARISADRLAGYGIQVHLAAEPTPTPALAYFTVQLQLDGAINFTASHNPAEYNGLKFSAADGAPALPEVTHAIEALLGNRPAPLAAGTITAADPRPLYLNRLRELVDLGAIARSGLRLALDPLWGTARGYTATLLADAGIPYAIVHDTRDVLFGGHAPEPETENTRALAACMAEQHAALGLATDGDADRFGILDQDGSLISPNYIIALLFDYLVESRGWRNGVGKSVATTNLINAVAASYGIPLHETPVGFKYLGELIKQDSIAIGGEESAGLSIRHHVPEKDGIIAGLLVAEMVAVRKRSLAEQLQALFAKVGSFYPLRENFPLTAESALKLSEKLASAPATLGGRKVASIVRTDGLKLILEDGAWVLLRPSGTEPVVRLYIETRTREDQPALLAAARAFVLS